MDFPLVIIPVECEAKVSFAFPLGFALVVLLDCIEEVLCVLLANIFYSEIVDY